MDNTSPTPGTGDFQQTEPGNVSSESRCCICLDRYEDVSYLNRCFHKFCFHCIQTWSETKAECPLCKLPFDSIFHSVRADDDFEEYVVRPSYNGSVAAPGGQRFLYGPTVSSDQSDSAYSPSSTVNRRTTTSLPRVRLEGLDISTRHGTGDIPGFTRQIPGRPTTADERSLPQIQEQDINNFNQTLYGAGARVRNIEDGGRYRDNSAHLFRRNPACLHRLVPWLQCKLRVLFGAHGSSVNRVQQIVMRNVTRYDVESQEFMSDLRPFLLNQTEHFIQEFISFTSSIFNMAVFDQHANYYCPAPSYEEGSHSDSSVITISSDEAETQELDINVATVCQASWDDETPGPSYSDSQQIYAAMSSPLNTSNNFDDEFVTGRAMSQIQGVQTNEDLNNDSDSSSDDCAIVGFIKPLAERTPELVELSSNSEDLDSYDKIETVSPPEQEQFYCSDDSDVGRCSSPHTIHGEDEQINTDQYDSGTGIESEEEEEQSMSLSSPRDLSLPVRGDRVYSPRNQGCRRRRRSRSSDSRSQSRSGDDPKHCRKHHGEKRMQRKQFRSRESRRCRERRDRKTSSRHSRWLRRSQTLSLNGESTSRSRSCSSDDSIRRSRSRTRHHQYYGSRCNCKYTNYNRNKDRDDYVSSYREKTPSRTDYSRQSSSLEFRIQSFSERRTVREENNHSKRKYYYNERHRSKSLCSERSAELFRRNPSCLHRLVPWLKHKLTALFGDHRSLVNIVQEIIMRNVTCYDLESQEFEYGLRPFLLNQTEHFIQEFISFASSLFNMASFDQGSSYDCSAPSNEEGGHFDSSVIASPEETETQELDINVATVSQAPWDDETPGPSSRGTEQAYTAMSSFLNTPNNSDEGLVMRRAMSQNQEVQTNENPNNASDSSDSCATVGFVKLLAERTPELAELSFNSKELDSYDKIETVSTPEQEQSYSSDDSDVGRCSSPHSVHGEDEQINTDQYDSGTGIESKEEEEQSMSLSSPRDLSLPVRGDRVYSPHNQGCRRRRRSRSSDSRSQSRSGDDPKHCRKHHGEKRMQRKQFRSRESRRCRERRDRKTSSRHSRWLRRSQTLSLNGESTSRSRSCSSDDSIRRSRSSTRHHQHYGSRCNCKYTNYNRNKDRDDYESSYREKTRFRADYSRQPSSPEFRIQSFSEKINARKKHHLSERKYYYNRHRSKHPSSDRLKTPSTGPEPVRNEKPGGKRKYKTRHMEGTHEVTHPSCKFASKGKECDYQISLPKLDGNHNECDSFSDSQSSDRETEHKRKKRRTRSLSAETDYEGNTTNY